MVKETDPIVLLGPTRDSRALVGSPMLIERAAFRQMVNGDTIAVSKPVLRSSEFHGTVAGQAVLDIVGILFPRGAFNRRMSGGTDSLALAYQLRNAAATLATAQADALTTGAAVALTTTRVAELRAAAIAAESNVALAIATNGLALCRHELLPPLRRLPPLRLRKEARP